MSDAGREAEDLIAQLGLQRHPEGGWFAEAYRAPIGPDGGAPMTNVYFLLRRGERSHWHRLHGMHEVWHHYAGDPLELSVFDGRSVQRQRLGPDIAGGQRPQGVVPADLWQSARSLGAWTLVGCTVAPGFEFEHFELAPPGWSPDGHPGR